MNFNRYSTIIITHGLLIDIRCVNVKLLINGLMATPCLEAGYSFFLSFSYIVLFAIYSFICVCASQSLAHQSVACSRPLTRSLYVSICYYRSDVVLLQGHDFSRTFKVLSIVMFPPPFNAFVSEQEDFNCSFILTQYISRYQPDAQKNVISGKRPRSFFDLGLEQTDVLLDL